MAASKWWQEVNGVNKHVFAVCNLCQLASGGSKQAVDTNGVAASNWLQKTSGSCKYAVTVNKGRQESSDRS